jgi:hypothetical protein
MSAPVALTTANDITTYANVASATATLAKPANTTDGDVLFAVILNRTNAGSITTVPVGWTEIASNTTNSTYGVYYKPIASAAAESATNYSWTVSASSRMAGVLFRVTGAKIASPVDAVGSIGPNVGTTQIVLPAVTAVSPATLLVAVAMDVQQNSPFNATWTADSLMTELKQVLGGGSGSASVSIQVAVQTLTSAGSTATRTPTVSPNVTNVGGIMFTIAPASALNPAYMHLTQGAWSPAYIATLSSGQWDYS